MYQIKNIGKKPNFAGLCYSVFFLILILSACSNPVSDNTGDPTLSGTISIQVTGGAEALTGATLIAVYSGIETVTYQWNKAGDPGFAEIGETFTPDTAGIYSVTVNAEGFTGKTSGSVLVSDHTLPKLTGTLIITGTAEVGQTLTADNSGLSGSGTYTYLWKSGDTEVSVNTDIGSNDAAYTLTEADKGKFISVSVICSDSSGTITSSVAGPVTGGNAVVGETLAAKLSWLKANAESNTVYNIEVKANEGIEPHVLLYTGKTNITINMNGVGSEKIISLSSKGAMFTVGEGVTLILNNYITIKGRTDNNNASAVIVANAGTLIMNDGAKITGNKLLGNYSGGIKGFGGGVNVAKGGTFIMKGGEITGNSVDSTNDGSGGGVYNGGNFTMEGGKIFANTATNGGSRTYGGGGVCSDGTEAVFEMISGIISENTSKNGGGVVIRSGSFTMNNGTIRDNTATTTCGGGVYIYSGVFTMKNGNISGNKMINGGGGGGVMIDPSATFILEDGEIINNAISGFGGGGGVCCSNGKFTMIGGKISANTINGGESSANGGGVQIESGTFTFEGGEISGNITNGKEIFGGGLYLSGGKVIMNNGDIKDNVADGITVYGGGVYIKTGTGVSFTLNNGSIKNNTAKGSKVYGGGVYVYGSSSSISYSTPVKFIMKGGDISGNYANGTGENNSAYGGGVYVDEFGDYSYDSFTMEGNSSLITGNTVAGSIAYGGGVYVNNGSLNRTEGVITAYDPVNEPNGNVVKDDSGIVVDDKGHAAYAVFKLESHITATKMRRETTVTVAESFAFSKTFYSAFKGTWIDDSI